MTLTSPNVNAIRGRHLGVGACILRELSDGSPQTQMQSSGYQQATRALRGVRRRGVAGAWPRSTGGTRHRSIRDVLCCDSKWPDPSKDPESSARKNRMLCEESHPSREPTLIASPEPRPIVAISEPPRDRHHRTEAHANGHACATQRSTPASLDGPLLADTTEWLTLSESLPHQLNQITRQVAEIAKRLVLDLSVFTKRASEVPLHETCV